MDITLNTHIPGWLSEEQVDEGMYDEVAVSMCMRYKREDTGISSMLYIFCDRYSW